MTYLRTLCSFLIYYWYRKDSKNISTFQIFEEEIKKFLISQAFFYLKVKSVALQCEILKKHIVAILLSYSKHTLAILKQLA